MHEEVALRRRKVIRDGLVIGASILIGLAIYNWQLGENFLSTITGVNFALGSFVVGIAFASTFTVASAASIFAILAQTHDIFLMAIFGGLGALVGDSLIFKFLRDDLLADFEYLEQHFPKKTARRIIHSKMTLWFAPIVAALLIASPLPDEIGILMLAGLRLKYKHFLLISIFLNTLGIFMVGLAARILL